MIAGALSGVSAAEFFPIAIFEGVVIAGLFVACMMPARRLRTTAAIGDRTPEPAPTPPPMDPTIWVRLLAESNLAVSRPAILRIGRRANSPASRAEGRSPGIRRRARGRLAGRNATGT